MLTSPPTRRLCVLVDAGRTPCALDALCVRGVAQPEADAALKDLTQLLGGGQEAAPGLAVALEVPAGLGLRVRAVHGVVDVSSARTLALPGGVSPRLARVVRGALELEGRLFLDVDLLALEGELPAADGPAPAPSRAALETARTLVFRAGTDLWAVPLAVVTQVVPAAGMCPTPGRSAALLQHGGALWPVYALGREAADAGMVVLVEEGGRPLGLLADEVVGIFDQMVPAGQPGTWSVPGAEWAATGLELALLFA